MSASMGIHGVTRITVSAVSKLEKTSSFVRDLVITFDDGQEISFDLFGDRVEDLQVTSKF